MRISDWSSDVCSSDLVRRQGDVLLGPGADRGDRGLRVALDAAGDDRRVHPLLLHLLHEAGDRLAHVDHDEIGAGTVAQDPQAALEVWDVADFRTTLHGDLAGGGDVALQGADDQQAHRIAPGITSRSPAAATAEGRSEEHTSELKSL